ncbi:hypothetical protein Cgig2_008335 [Carnegiea gigantea]|uniref:DUF4283 domain-containing protein n=1 Tax=Carnegiea gigantea TaxID=171969 RepID=A0A9Q1K780_9CARY|nr:hypothetical protein Cgig2_008335 [Carnegiea gigantea]
MARGGKRGRSRPVNVISPDDTQTDQSEEFQAPAGEETHQGKVLAIKSNGIVSWEDKPPNTQVQSARSYASLVDPKEGIELKFVSAEIIDDKKIAKIEREDTAVICSILGANPPYEIIQGFVKGIWGPYEIDKILQVRKGVFLPFLVELWNRQMDLQTENIKSLPIWVQLPDLDIKIWDSDSLSKIGSTLGFPLKTDKYTRDKIMIKYVRLLIDIPHDGHFPDNVEFFNEGGVLVRQQVHYKWKPIKYTHYKMLGHEEANCIKKGGVRIEWRPI